MLVILDTKWMQGTFGHMPATQFEHKYEARN